MKFNNGYLWRNEVIKVTDGGGGTVDDNNAIRFIQMFQEIINQNEITREVIKTLNDHIRTISGILVDRGKILQALVCTVGPLADLKKEAMEGNLPMCKLTFGIRILHLHKFLCVGPDGCNLFGLCVAFLVRCLDLAFQPPEGMNFQRSEFAVTAYIFSKNLDKRVIGVHCGACDWGSKLLMTLSSWWPLCSASTTSFLTTFPQIALSPVNHSIDTFEFIHTNFMGYADNLHRIYVSIEATLVPDDCGYGVPQAHLPGFCEEFIGT
ncbi:hypothetical protein AHAS_Ahas15G0144700 [Arachis hypogaea]